MEFEIYPKKRIGSQTLRHSTKNTLLATLCVVQDTYGSWLLQEMMGEITRPLKLLTVDVQDVATFFMVYNTKPSGQPAEVACLPLVQTHEISLGSK